MDATTFPQADHTNQDANGKTIPCAIYNDELVTCWTDVNGNTYWLRIKAIDVEWMQIQTENPFEQ